MLGWGISIFFGPRLFVSLGRILVFIPFLTFVMPFKMVRVWLLFFVTVDTVICISAY